VALPSAGWVVWSRRWLSVLESLTGVVQLPTELALCEQHMLAHTRIELHALQLLRDIPGVLRCHIEEAGASGAHELDEHLPQLLSLAHGAETCVVAALYMKLPLMRVWS
jgi:hypothetical protein